MSFNRFLFLASISLVFGSLHASSDKVDPKAQQQLCQCSDTKGSKKVLDLKLSNAITRPCYNTYPSISKTGDQVYLGYNVNPGIRVAELFNNVNGKLKSVATIPFDPEFPSSLGNGYAAPDFNRFSFLDFNVPKQKNNCRIRIFNKKLKVVAARLFTVPFHTFPFAGSFIGGTFSEDGQYVLITYINNPAAVNAISTLVVLRTSDLSTVAENKHIRGYENEAPRLFTLKNKKGRETLYISFVNSSGQFTQAPLESLQNTSLPPYFDQVYKVNTKTGKIKLVDQLPLPKFAQKDVLSRGSDALIAHGGFQSSFPHSKSIYDPLPPELLTRLPHDNAEPRVSIFDGKKLRVAIKQALDNCNATIIYPPGLGCYYQLGQNTYFQVIPGSIEEYSFQSEFYCMAGVEKNADGVLEFTPQNLPNQEGNHAFSVFSTDGKWLLRVGSYGYNVPPDFKPRPDMLGMHNIILKKVVSRKFTPVCKTCSKK